ncbi:MAG: hypothetical protein AAB241_06115, partial [Pseudomonadota bacterium]
VIGKKVTGKPCNCFYIKPFGLGQAIVKIFSPIFYCKKYFSCASKMAKTPSIPRSMRVALYLHSLT